MDVFERRVQIFGSTQEPSGRRRIKMNFELDIPINKETLFTLLNIEDSWIRTRDGERRKSASAIHQLDALSN